jgi:hypothetical protein
MPALAARLARTRTASSAPAMRNPISIKSTPTGLSRLAWAARSRASNAWAALSAPAASGSSSSAAALPGPWRLAWAARSRQQCLGRVLGPGPA